ncbi:MAG TPA: hypothetical protein VE978_02790 [Chitinophagales bacterium]|nr:hypothetical protein [Chitinophagales bacterium]
MKKLLLCFLVLLACHFSYSQKQDYNWCFGDSCGINFNDSTGAFFLSSSSFDTSYITGLENTASISDSLGNLLFYTNGSIVWDRNHQENDTWSSFEHLNYSRFINSSQTR